MAAKLHTCKHCANQFYPSRPDNSTFCSRDCSITHRRENKLPKEELKRRAAARSVLQRKQFDQRACVICRAPFQPRMGKHEVCGPACRTVRNRQLAYKYSIRQSSADKSERQCNECGDTFTPAYGEKRRAFCSKLCQKRNTKRTTRSKGKALKRALTVESVNPTLVFDRDGWRCQLCGVRTPRKLRGLYDPRSPELDHIVPLSQGGSHSYVNTQCCCRQCNAEKGSKPLGQALLFG